MSALGNSVIPAGHGNSGTKMAFDFAVTRSYLSVQHRALPPFVPVYPQTVWRLSARTDIVERCG